MKRSFSYPILCSALLALGLNAALSAEEQTTSSKAPMGRKDAVLMTVTASVEAIDADKREVTLKGPLGNSFTFTVDPRVKRLNEVKVGDFVRADYYISIAAELRKPTAEEAKHPLVVLDAEGKAARSEAPAGGTLRRFKVVTTIEGLDRPTRTVTVKGPRGNYLTARVADPDRLTKVHIGDTVVITYTEAMAISLEKAEKKSAE